MFTLSKSMPPPKLDARLLVIQIPCLNEAECLPATLADLPGYIPGIARLERMVIDDGSTDRTADVARHHGVEHVIRFTKHRGLARAFDCGLRHALNLDADVIVNTDADNQYSARFIPDLIRPILDGTADVVIGTRPIDAISEFSWVKKKMQKSGSWLVRKVSGTDVRDATSGFRAFNRRAASCMKITSDFTYTVETIFLAAKYGLRIAQVPVAVNAPLRKSRLARNSFDYVLRSSQSLIRSYLL